MKFNYYIFLIAIFIVFTHTSVFSQNDQNFTIILDAGHGGKDPGNSYHGYTEKDIALKTTLKVGGFLEKAADFKVVYTRTTDVFIELANRPKIANKANANLFVSIHCNSVKSFQPYGTETFVMGLSRSDLNLEVAKKENSVILLEDNFKDTYQGFDPNKPESLIGLTILQEENLNNSIILATEIQGNFTHNLKRNSRGIKQQPLWVLDAVYMPSVLIELGFLSNREEGEFLNSEEGQDQMALQIAKAIVEYKKKYFGTGSIVNSKVKNNTAITVSAITTSSSDTIYKVQLLASSKNIPLIPSNFKGLNNITSTFDNEIYRYMYGAASTIQEVKKMKLEAQLVGYPDAFVVTSN
ncbi:N-acetylmuramoyl-L-alanine amidase family protein [Flavobacterium frigoris]|uniref:N-acetylmuramoyl-L-alanine amidase n=1 Tax=Flavobacterium frigoris TaxID=229204 RepID=A0A1H9HML0_FLAFI|nr:N-acetylmuramoyl-L-alanine amidase [Flavobacterium frigoris]SEQ63547.1 N-acetylmuramoyl-L-alanine amidase [Flavobacterium frigoris]